TNVQPVCWATHGCTQPTGRLPRWQSDRPSKCSQEYARYTCTNRLPAKRDITRRRALYVQWRLRSKLGSPCPVSSLFQLVDGDTGFPPAGSHNVTEQSVSSQRGDALAVGPIATDDPY